MTVLEFIILGLATYRITRFVTTDALFEPLRERIWKRFPVNTKVGYLFTCNWCMSFWVGSLVVLSAMIITELVIVYAIFAVSAIAGLLTAYEER